MQVLTTARALAPNRGAPKAPTITKLADGGLAIASGKVKVTHLLIAVNGTIVKGHEDGTLIATDDVPCMQVLTTALSDGSLPEDGTLIATDDVPCMQVLTTALPDGSLPEDGTLIATDDVPCMQVLIAARPPGRYGAAQECCRRHRADALRTRDRRGEGRCRRSSRGGAALAHWCWENVELVEEGAFGVAAGRLLLPA